jgi:hypothetical protein
MEIGEKSEMSTPLFLHAEIKKVLIIIFEANPHIVNLNLFQLCFNQKNKREPELNPTLSFSIERETGIEPATLSLGS